MMSDTSAFTPTHRKSSSSGTVIIDEDIPVGAPVTKYEWQGRAVVATDIVISATALGPVSATGSFGIQSRIGLRPKWMDSAFVDSSFAEAPPDPRYLSGSPLTRTHPGIGFRPDGYYIEEGALGITFFNAPAEVRTITLAGVGPNTGVKFVLDVMSKVDPRSLGQPAGPNLEQSLLSDDPFYRRQVRRTSLSWKVRSSR